MSSHYYHEHAGLIFLIFPSSLKGKLNVSLNCGSREFLGYVDTYETGITLIESKF